MSDWFFHPQRIEVDPGRVAEWKNSARHLDVSVKTANEDFRIKSDSEFDTKVSGASLSVIEHVAFSIETMGADFPLDDLRERPIEFASLLSILIGHPLSISSIRIVDGKGEHAYIYYPSFKHDVREEPRSWAEFLLKKPSLDGKWQEVIERFYKSAHRKLTWRRLAGLQRYEGFWEYRIVGYVSILDYYVNQRFSRRNAGFAVPTRPKLTGKDIRKVLRALSSVTTEEVREAIKEELKKIEREDSNLSVKFEHAIKDTDQDIAKIFDFSQEEFKEIRIARDQVAHGLEFTGEFQRLHNLVDKVSLLLTYWAFEDFGLTKEDFVRGLTVFHAPIRQGAKLNEMEFARVAGTARFLPVSRREFSRISALKGRAIGVCLDEQKNGNFRFSASRTKAYRNWLENTSKAPGLIAWNDVFHVKEGTVTSAGSAYLTCGKDSLNLHSVFLFAPSARMRRKP